MVHEIYDEKMSVEMSLFLLTLQEKQVILVNLRFCVVPNGNKHKNN